MYWLAIVIILVLLLLWSRRESFADIMGDIPNNPPAGTWSDGIRKRPCTECTDETLCPQCTQFAPFYGTSPQASIDTMIVQPAAGCTGGGPGYNYEGFEVPTPKYKEPSPPDPLAMMLGAYPNPYEYDLQNIMAHDLDPDFTTSRERMGAVSTVAGPWRRPYSIAYLGTHNDDIFDGDRAVTPGPNMCKSANTPLNRLVYRDAMGLNGSDRPASDCEILNYNGVSYRQPC